MTEDVDADPVPVEEAGENQQIANNDAPQPRPSKKKRASKSTSTTQLVDVLTEMQKQHQDTMKQFLDGMREMEDSSRRHTAETLVGVAKLFADNRKRRREYSESDTE